LGPAVVAGSLVAPVVVSLAVGRFARGKETCQGRAKLRVWLVGAERAALRSQLHGELAKCRRHYKPRFD
jgi:hypothetical protein